MDSTTKRPIDERRDGPFSMEIGTPDEGEITGFVNIGDEALYAVKARAIYRVKMADDIDPARTNLALPPAGNQRVLDRGSDDPIVGRTLLTAETLMKRDYLTNFDELAGRRTSVDLALQFAAMADMRSDLENAQRGAIVRFTGRAAAGFVLPAIGDAKARCDAFAQKAGHVAKSVRSLAELFYGTLPKKWAQALCEIVSEKHGEASNVAKFCTAILPTLLFAIEMRNMVEHPRADWQIDVRDFSMTPEGTLVAPSAEIIDGLSRETVPLLGLMDMVSESLLSAAEGLMAHFCGVRVHPVAGLDVHVAQAPADFRPSKHVRFRYMCYFGDQLAPFG